MNKWQKILLVAFHAVMLVLFLFMVLKGLQLRWRLGYVLFWMTALSGCAVYFIRGKKRCINTISRIYAFCWILLSIAGIIFTFLTFDAVYCETDKYIMKEPSVIIGFDSAILYEKKGLLEVEKQRYKFVHPKSFTPLDSIGAIVIYGDFDNGETTDDGVAILPLDDSFDKEKH
ncbi:hypothetical protein [Duncaniella muricolitica]|jgi:hypothetical protein|uniref:hypothetical protein n=1 Tax=Duncaniella muricolitica TaxID=2880704 RepID=UPI000F51A499|nr:hypothetical protein [Duncaniella muricolitica]